MDRSEIQQSTINSGFGAAAGVYLYHSGLQPGTSIALTMLVFAGFHGVVQWSGKRLGARFTDRSDQ